MSKLILCEVNFKEVCGLKHAIGGFVAKIDDAKGIRRELQGTNRYTYGLHHSSVGLPVNDVYRAPEGIYYVCDICKWGGSSSLQWNIYIVVVTLKGSYPVAEFLDNPNTMWVKETIPLLKEYFSGEGLEPIELTKEPSKTKEEKWKTGYKSTKKLEVPFGFARVTTAGGKDRGVFKILRHSSKYIELVMTDKSTYRFNKSDGSGVTNANLSIEYTL